MNKRGTRNNGMLPVVILILAIMIFGIKIIGGMTSTNDIDANLVIAEAEATSEGLIEQTTEAPTEAPTEALTQVPTKAPTEAPTQAPTQALTQAPTQAQTLVVDASNIDESSYYYETNDVALYLHTFGHLPPNYITKNQAKEKGWVADKGNLWDVAEGMVIGGDYYGNYEDKLADASGRKYYECDVNYEGGYRNAYRIVFSNDGLIYYTKDHYETFTRLY